MHHLVAVISDIPRVCSDGNVHVLLLLQFLQHVETSVEQFDSEGFHFLDLCTR